MKSPNIQAMSNEALRQRLKTTQLVTGVLAGMLAVLLVMAILLCLNKQSSVGLPLLFVPLSLSSILYINVNDVRGVRRELQSRNQVL